MKEPTTWELQVRIMMIVISTVILTLVVLTFTSCHILEINMVNRSTMDSGDGVSSTRKELITDVDEDELQLIVPLK